MMKLDQVVPFGRSFDEYVKMFSLSEADLALSILSVADGPASFNAEGTQQGYRIHSVDPLYVFSAEQIRDRFYAVRDNIIGQVKATRESWVWTYHASPEALEESRTRTAERFAADFEAGKQQGRYAAGALPELSYSDSAYELALCSHFLFLYAEQFDTAFHISAVSELLRLCQEVRIFPLLNLSQETAPQLAPVMEHFEQNGYLVAVEKVAYEFQPGGNKMLKIRRA